MSEFFEEIEKIFANKGKTGLDQFQFWWLGFTTSHFPRLAEVLFGEVKSKIFCKIELTSVVYFDQQTCAPHAVRWSKSIF